MSVCFVALIVDCSRSWLGCWCNVVGPVLRSHDAVGVCFARVLITVTVHVVVNGESQALGVLLFGNSCSRGQCVTSMLVMVQYAQLGRWFVVRSYRKKKPGVVVRMIAS